MSRNFESSTFFSRWKQTFWFSPSRKSLFFYFSSKFKKILEETTFKGTPGEDVRDAIIKAGLETAKESGYATGNPTEKLVTIASNVGSYVDRGTELVGGVESAGA